MLSQLSTMRVEALPNPPELFDEPSVGNGDRLVIPVVAVFGFPWRSLSARMPTR